MTRALLLIDVQKIYTTKGSPFYVEGHEAAIANINRIIDASVSAGDLIIYVRHQHRADGSDAGRMFDYTGTKSEIGFVENTELVELDPALKIVEPAMHLTKHRYSCLAGTKLAAKLRQKNIDTIVVTGFMTNFCCETTARHAHDADFYVDFIMDATGCPDLSETVTQDRIKEIVAASLSNGFARVQSTSDFLRRDGNYENRSLR